MKKLYTLTALLITSLSFAQNILTIEQDQSIDVSNNITAIVIKNGVNVNITNSNITLDSIVLKGNNILNINHNVSTHFKMNGNSCVIVGQNITGGQVTAYGLNNNIHADGNITNSFSVPTSPATIISVSEGGSYSCPAPVDCAVTTMYKNGAWSNGFPQSYTMRAEIYDDYQITQDFKACSLKIINGGGSPNLEVDVTLVSGNNIELLDRLYLTQGTGCHSNLTIENNANLVQVRENLEASNFGNVKVKRNSNTLFRLDYTMWSSPVQGQQLLEFSPLTQTNRFYSYNTLTSTFISTDATTDFEKGKGYLIRMPHTGSPEYNAGTQSVVFNGEFTGVINNGTIETPLVYQNTEGNVKAFNMVGNPYPSTINLYEFLDVNEELIDGTLYFWRKRNNPDAPSYTTINRLGVVKINNAEGGDNISGEFPANMADYEINVGQGFFVKALAEGNLQFNNSMRGKRNNAVFFRNGSAPVRYWLDLTTTENSDIFSQALIGHTTETTAEYNNGWDGVSMMSGTAVLYSHIESYDLAIQARGEFEKTDEVLLGFKTEVAGEFTIQISAKENIETVYLYDADLDLYHDLNTPYTFTTEVGNFKERFKIVYRTPENLSAQTVEVVKPIVYVKDGVVYGKSAEMIKEIKVYDIQGRIIKTVQNNTNTFEIPLQQKGVYIVETDKTTHKILN